MTAIHECDDGELCRRANAGDREARNRLVARHYRACWDAADRYAARSPGVDAEELSQEAAFALLDAIRGFDPERGVPFGSHAASAIRRRIVAAAKDRATRLLPQAPDEGGDAIAEGSEPGRE